MQEKIKRFTVLAASATLLLAAYHACAGTIRFELERYHLDQLRVYKIGTRPQNPYALVYKAMPPGEPADLLRDTYLFHVEKEEYLGENFGQVKRINHCGIWIVQLIQDEQGDWLEHKVVLKTDRFDADAKCVHQEHQWVSPKSK
ncbi:MAG TPA: pilus assembly protein PilP [Burkholderiales bacterium]